MVEKNAQTTASPKKKIYKSPVPVKSVESGRILDALCPYSCGSQVININNNCGH